MATSIIKSEDKMNVDKTFNYKGVWVKRKRIDWGSMLGVIFVVFIVCLFYSWQADWFDGLGFNGDIPEIKAVFGIVGLLFLIVLFIVWGIFENEKSEKYKYVWERRAR